MNKQRQAPKIDPMRLAINEVIANSAVSRAREAMRGGGGAIDAKRSNAWAEYGFPDDITADMLYNLYRRNGLAHGAVSKVVGTCWETEPWIIEGDKYDEKRPPTDWEKSAQLALPKNLWQRVEEADKRATVCRSSALVLRIRDSRPHDQPVKAGSIIEEAVPVWSAALKVAKWDEDVKSATYGQPLMWEYSESSKGGTGKRTVKIHADRVVLFGDTSADAIGFLEPAYNAFVSLEKVEGGSGEAFLKNASRQIVTSFDKDVDLGAIAQTYGVSLDELQAKFNQAALDMNRGNDQMLVLQGATATPLVANVPDPRPTHEVNISTVAAALDIPKRLLIGNQQGDMASTEDLKYWMARCQSRRVRSLSSQIGAMVEKLQRIGILSPAVFTVMWDDLREATAGAKLESAKMMTEINSLALGTGEAVFQVEEIRVAAGYEVEEEFDLGEDEPVADPDATVAAV